MRNRIRNITILMVTCIIVVFCFQAYFLYKSYAFHLDQFGREINDAMRTAVFNKQFADVRRIVRYGNNDTTQNDLPKEVRQLLNADKRNEGKPYRELKIYLNDSTRQTAKLDSSAHVYVDTLAKQISEILIINNIYGNRFSLKRLDSVFTTELVNRGITSAHRLDTFHIDFNNFARESFRDSLHIREAFKTSKTPFNPISNLFVQASFETPVPYILKQMMWTLISSVLVLILTSISMIYMMRTILKQKKLSEVKNDFINNMTHELKTPIATVYAAVEAMQNFNALNDQQKTENYLNISKQQLQRLSDLVEKVLHIAAEEKETIDLYPEDVDMLEIITSIVNNHELKANKPVNFHIEVPEDAFIMADKTHLSNAINNLVDNAIKYSKEQADITIRIYKQENNWKIVVKDKGIGIPKSYQDTIFEKFFRVPTGDLHNVKGFGLGLSYVKKIVDMHTGTITVHSEPNSGSEFIITIPA